LTALFGRLHQPVTHVQRAEAEPEGDERSLDGQREQLGQGAAAADCRGGDGAGAHPQHVRVVWQWVLPGTVLELSIKLSNPAINNTRMKLLTA